MNTQQPNKLTPEAGQSIVQELKHMQTGSGIFEPEVLILTSYPPRECGIATYSCDLINALNNTFKRAFRISVCALQTDSDSHLYNNPVTYKLNTENDADYDRLAAQINANSNIEIVVLQHEYGFYHSQPNSLLRLLKQLHKKIVLVLHTVLPNPDENHKLYLQRLAGCASQLVVMTHNSARILEQQYCISAETISVIPHGTHLVSHEDKDDLKARYNVEGRTVLATFGLISPGKSIETSLRALPAIIKSNPDVIFLILGITHPTLKKHEGESYRNMLINLVEELHLKTHVKFVNQFLELPVLLDYLQLADIYLFTSKDPNQAVSGTFSYAISCGCPVISTPIPHAREVLSDDAGITIDFENSSQLATAVIRLLNDESLRAQMASNGLHRIAQTAWENSALAYANLFQKLLPNEINLKYKWPEINLSHFKKLTTDFGMIQFSKINQPDLSSGYTLDDNARAMIAICQHYAITDDQEDLDYIQKYLGHIEYCQDAEGYFLNYTDQEKKFTAQNASSNLADANGRAVWALGYLLSYRHLLPSAICIKADTMLQRSVKRMEGIYSTRAMAFLIKGLYYYQTGSGDEKYVDLLRLLSNRMVQMYRHEKQDGWEWFEGYLTYANSVLPEAMLCAWLATGDPTYRDVAKKTFDFLLSKTFRRTNINVVSNKTWLQKNMDEPKLFAGGEQPIDVAYCILALLKFRAVFHEPEYEDKMHIAFNWFLGANHLNQIIYNKCTGGCYDGLEFENVNLNQGAESTISYLLARCTMEQLRISKLAHSDIHEEPFTNLHESQIILTEYLS